MRKSFLYVFIAISFAMVVSGSVSAQDVSQGRGYIAVDGGVRFVHVDGYDVGYLFGGAIGYDTEKGPRGELAVSYSNNGLSDFSAVDVGFLTILGKGCYDFHISDTSFTPYIGFALGYGRASASATVSSITLSATDSAFVFGSTAGFRAALNDKVSAGVEYSFLGYDIDDPDFLSGLTLRLYYKF